MKLLQLILLTSLLLFFYGSANSQTPRRSPARVPAAPRPQASQPPAAPSPTPIPATQPFSPVPLAIVNGQAVTIADIDKRARAEVENLAESIADARRQVLQIQINTALLELEGQKRKLTPQQLYNLEVSKRVTDPAEAEVKRFIEDNRDQLDQADSTTIRPQVISLLRANREAKISEEFVQRLRNANPVVIGVDINTPRLPESAVLATVAGRPITAAAIIERLKPTIYKLRLNAYEIQKEALEKTINDMLLVAEANRRNVPPEAIVRTEISEKVRPPTEAEVAKFYSENRTRISGDFDSVRNQLAQYLQEQERQRLERAMSEGLRKGADVRLLISEPQPPVQLISSDDDPSRGDRTASVTVVEFTDFQCPSCAAMHPILEEVLKAYGSKVKFVVRDFPLPIHAHARKAAEAANAAHAQGRFFEYAALLFKRQKMLDIPSLKNYASELGLDRARFDAALDGGNYASEVRHDIDEAEAYGVDSTPTIFVNGVILKTLTAEALRAAVDRALVPPATQKSPPK